jgi:hypothetical protein
MTDNLTHADVGTDPEPGLGSQAWSGVFPAIGSHDFFRTFEQTFGAS